jgi:hypothetical protein
MHNPETTNPLALAVIDAARAYRRGRSKAYNVVSGHDLDRALAAWDAARIAERHTLPDGTVVLVEGGGVVV